MACKVIWMSTLAWILLFFIGSGFVKTCWGNAVLFLKFGTFSNYGGLTDRGMCCDGVGNKACTSKCDHSFDVCVSNERKESLRGQCPYGRVMSGAITDKNYIQFETTIGRSDNPLLFPIETWPPKIYLSVDVVDKDDDNDDDDDDEEDDVVARLERTIILSPNNITKTILMKKRVELSMEVRGFCAPNYYGLECAVYCYVQNKQNARYSCDENGRKLCNPGWGGQECDENVDDCASSPCSHSGTCIDLVNGYRCECPSQYSGLTCLWDVDECASQTDACFNGTCVNEIGSYRCDCNVGYTGPKCQEDINECQDSPCQNGGVCSESTTPGGFYCTCTDGFTGRLCEENINECATIGDFSQPICQHKGLCVDTMGSFYCDCPSSWTGQICQENVDECAKATIANKAICQNNGTCVDTVGSFLCKCSQFWTGEFCQTNIDECVAFPESPCFQTGTISCRNLDEGFECVCAKGWTGALCDADINECKTMEEPCRNGGQCTNLDGSFKCDCRPGWDGERCEDDVNECDDEYTDDVTICQNGGTCINLIGGFSCQCTDFWDGEICDKDLDECKLEACSKNSTKQCKNFPGGFECVCHEGWTGTTCSEDVDECKGNSSVCLEVYSADRNESSNDFQPEMVDYNSNNEHDIERLNSRQRSKGDNSDNFMKERNSTKSRGLPPLLYNETSRRSNFVCTNTMPGYRCTCDVGWTGDRCDSIIVTKDLYETDLPPDVHTQLTTQPSTLAGSMVGLVIVLILATIMTIVIVVIIVLRRRRRKKATLNDGLVTYVNEGFADKTSAMPRINGFHYSDENAAPVEIPHMYLCGQQKVRGDHEKPECTVLKEVASSDTTSLSGNVDIHFHYEVPENVEEREKEENEDEEEMEGKRDKLPSSNQDLNDVIVRKGLVAPPLPSKVNVNERSRSRNLSTTATIVVDENQVKKKKTDTDSAEDTMSGPSNIDSGIFVVENNMNNNINDTVYVSRVDFVINDGNVLSQSHSTQEDNRYEQLPYINTTATVEDGQ